MLGSSIVFLDSAVLTVALPAIGREPRLFVDVLEAQNYIQYGYLLTLSSLLILAGALSDFYGRRRMFVIGLVGFGVASVLCGLAPNLELLILARLLQGAAGALLVPGSLAILTNNFEGEEQGRAFGIWAAASGLAPILGPFIGGILVDNFSWRWIFLLNLPFTLVAIYAALRYVKESRDERASSHFDWLGAFLVALAVGGLSFGAIYGQQRQWQDPLAFVAIAVGAHHHHRAAFLLRAGQAPAHPAVDVPLAQLHGDEHLDAADLWRAVRDVLLPAGVPAGHAGLHGQRRRPGQHPGLALPDLPVDPFGALAARYGPRAVHDRGPADHGRRAALDRAHTVRLSRPGASRSPIRRPGCPRPATSPTCCPTT